MAKRAQLPNGDILEFPDATPDAVMDKAVKAHLQQSAPKPKESSFWHGVVEGMAPAAEKLDAINPFQAIARATGLVPSQNQMRAAREKAFANTTPSGWGEFAGSLVGALPTMALPGGALVQGAAAGGLLSKENTLGGVAKDVALGAAAGKVGEVVGKAAVRGASKLARAARPAVQNVVAKVAGGTPSAAVRPSAPTKSGAILLKTLEDQGMTPKQAADMIAEAQRNGVPLALMDTGDEMRGLASALGRKPGPSRKLIRDVVVPRQAGQGERIQDAVVRDLGSTTSVRAQSELMMQNAQAAAKPHYDQAYQNSGAGAFTSQIDDLLRRPSMRGALGRAYRIAAEEGRDPKTLGFNFDAEGNVTINRDANSWQTLDYVKRGMDDIVESYRDSTTGRLNLDTEGRAINNTLREFLGRIDRANPDYAAARAAYAGPAKMTTALSKGAKIANKDAETIWAETRDLSGPELEHYRLGARTALSKLIDGKGDYADKIRALIGTPKKREALTQLFGGEEAFSRFMTTLEQEGHAAATHARVNTGSPTAANLADDTALDGGVGIATNALARGIKGQGIVSNAMATLGDLYKYGSGKAGERVRAELAAGLSETDPQAFAAAAKAARRGAAISRAASRRVEPVARKSGIAAGRASAAAAAARKD